MRGGSCVGGRREGAWRGVVGERGRGGRGAVGKG